MASTVNVREQGPSAEKLAFRQHCSDLIYAIGDPDVLSWKLYSNDLISANTIGMKLSRSKLSSRKVVSCLPP